MFIRIIVLSILVIGLSSCSSTKNGQQSGTKVSELKAGSYSYTFVQSMPDAACNYHKLKGDALIQFLEMNHTGDKDDRVPRQLVEMDDTVLSLKKSVTHSNPIETKICMDTKGTIVALRYESVSEKVKEALMDLQYEQRAESACVECKTLYVWAK